MSGSASILDGVPDWRTELLDWKERFDGEASQTIAGIDRWSQRLCDVTGRCVVSSHQLAWLRCLRCACRQLWR